MTDAAALAATKAYLRIADDGEDAVLGQLIGSALGLCEAFTGQVPVMRAVDEVLPVSPEWRRLTVAPVRAITAVAGLAADGAATALPASAYAIDLGPHGQGWVRVLDAGGRRQVRVTCQAGLAAGWAELPELLRQGVVRLAAHLYAHRDGGDDGGPPAAVAALWRPYRRMRLR